MTAVILQKSIYLQKLIGNWEIVRNVNSTKVNLLIYLSSSF